MDFKQLRYFVQVAQLGSFTKAALALDVAQPALSRQIRALEVELRQTLLLRDGRGAKVTEAGKQLLEHGLGILHQVDRALEDLGRVQGRLAGHVVVGMPTTLARRLAVPLMRSFRQQLPDARLSIREGLSVDLTEDLQIGRLDIALLYNPQHPQDLETKAISQEHLVLIQRKPSKDKGVNADTALAPINLVDLATMPLLIPSRPNAIRLLVDTEMARCGVVPDIALEIDGVTSILELVAEGFGNAVLSADAVADVAHPERFVHRPIVNPSLVTVMAMAVSARRPATLTQAATQGLIGGLLRGNG